MNILRNPCLQAVFEVTPTYEFVLNYEMPRRLTAQRLCRHYCKLKNWELAEEAMEMCRQKHLFFESPKQAFAQQKYHLTVASYKDNTQIVQLNFLKDGSNWASSIVSIRETNIDALHRMRILKKNLPAASLLSTQLTQSPDPVLANYGRAIHSLVEYGLNYKG